MANNDQRDQGGGIERQTPSEPPNGGEPPHNISHWRFLPKADISTAIATFLLFLVGFWGTIETNKSIELSERAWLGALGGQIISAPVSGQPMSYGIVFYNSGKEPALDVTIIHQDGLVPAPFGNDFRNMEVSPNVSCQDVKLQSGNGVVMPGSQYFRNITSADPPHPQVLTDEVLQGKMYYYTNGCAAYKTFGKIRHVSYCFVFQIHPNIVPTSPSVAAISGLQDGSTKKLDAPAAQSQAPPYQIVVSTCPTGNSAD